MKPSQIIQTKTAEKLKELAPMSVVRYQMLIDTKLDALIEYLDELYTRGKL